jgi:hypothetical protein
MRDLGDPCAGARPDGVIAVRPLPFERSIMETRSSSREISFRRPFLLGGLDGVQPPGAYTVLMEEERLDTPSVTAWRLLSLTLMINRAGVTEHVPIDRQDLDDALVRDGAAIVPPADARGRSRRARDLLRHGGRR